ncbi:MAG: hypothetical protein HY438_01695 [DPANN group archaeon]|nr:hypothetical protein [DPANN group archaeon]
MGSLSDPDKLYADALAKGEIVPSEGKEQGWQTYVNSSLQDLLTTPHATAEELASLHTAMAGHYAFALPQSFKDEAETCLFTQDRADGAEKEQLLNKTAGAKSLKERRRVLRELCEKDTSINYDVQPVGSLRSYGTRRTNGIEEKVFASHTCMFTSNASELFGMGAPEIYLGLSAGLDKVYKSLCTKYENLRNTAKTFDDVLAAEMFLQLWGARIIHPFWDGNGRTFGAHLALTLERQGIKIRKFQDMQGLVESLASLSDTFLNNVINDANLHLLSPQEVETLNVNHSARKQYMGALRTAMENGINAGVDTDGKYSAQIRKAAYLVKKYLFKQGFIGEDKLSAVEKTIAGKEKMIQGLLDESDRQSEEHHSATDAIRQKFGNTLAVILGADFFAPTLEAQLKADAKESAIECGTIKVLKDGETIKYDFTWHAPSKDHVRYYSEGGFSSSSQSYDSIDALLAEAVKEHALTAEKAQLLKAALEKAEKIYPHAEELKRIIESHSERNCELYDARRALTNEIQDLEIKMLKPSNV